MGVAVFWVIFCVLVLVVVANSFRRIEETKKFKVALRRGLFVIGLILMAGLIRGIYLMGDRLS